MLREHGHTGVMNVGVDTEVLTAEQAEEFLDGLPLVPAMAGSIQEMKTLRDKCLAVGIPALVGCPGGGKG